MKKRVNKKITEKRGKQSYILIGIVLVILLIILFGGTYFLNRPNNTELKSLNGGLGTEGVFGDVGSQSSSGVKCNNDSDCGVTGFVGNPTCYQGNVVQEYRIYTCVNPGLTTSYCNVFGTINTKEICGTGQICNNGQCVNKSLVAYYPFEGNANDLSGKGNNGVWGGTPSYTTGKIGQGASFNGVNNYINISNPSAFNNKGLTVSAWVKLSKPSQDNKWIVSKGQWGNDTSGDWWLGTIIGSMNSNTFRWGIYGSTPTFIDKFFYSTNAWYFLTGTYNGTEIDFYVNGFNIDKQFVSGFNTNSHNIFIGGESTNNAMFNGTVDEVKIWNYALNDSEIQAEFQRGNGCTLNCPVTTCATLDQPNTVYTQTANIVPNGNMNSCINITASNIIYDCNGFFISNISIYNEIGIYVNNVNNITIKNCKIVLQDSIPSNTIGIVLRGVNNSFIINDNVNSRSGVALYNSSNNDLYSIITEAHHGLGIYLYSSSNNNFSNITAHYGSYFDVSGISLSTGSKNNIFSYINASNNGGYLLSGKGVYIQSNSNFNIFQFSNMNANNYGVYIWNSSYNIIRNCDFSGNDKDTYLKGNCINNSFTNIGTPPTSSSNLIAYYPFEGNANDLSPGNINNGVWVGTPSYSIGKLGHAANLSGNNYINLGSSSSLNLVNSISIAAWIYLTSYGTNYPIIIDRRVTTNPNIHDQYDLVFVNPDGTGYNKINWAMQYGSSLNSFSIVSGSISLNSWHHVAGTFNGTNAYLYIDGNPITNLAKITIMPTGALGNTTLGSISSGGNYFTGLIDEVKIWNSSLSPGDIYQEYERGNSIGGLSFQDTENSNDQIENRTIINSDSNYQNSGNNRSNNNETNTNTQGVTSGNQPAENTSGNIENPLQEAQNKSNLNNIILYILIGVIVSIIIIVIILGIVFHIIKKRK